MQFLKTTIPQGAKYIPGYSNCIPYIVPNALLCRRSLPVIDALRRPLLDALIRHITRSPDALDADAPNAFYHCLPAAGRLTAQLACRQYYERERWFLFHMAAISWISLQTQNMQSNRQSTYKNTNNTKIIQKSKPTVSTNWGYNLVKA